MSVPKLLLGKLQCITLVLSRLGFLFFFAFPDQDLTTFARLDDELGELKSAEVIRNEAFETASKIRDVILESVSEDEKKKYDNYENPTLENRIYNEIEIEIKKMNLNNEEQILQEIKLAT